MRSMIYVILKLVVINECFLVVIMFYHNLTEAKKNISRRCARIQNVIFCPRCSCSTHLQASIGLVLIDERKVKRKKKKKNRRCYIFTFHNALHEDNVLKETIHS